MSLTWKGVLEVYKKDDIIKTNKNYITPNGFEIEKGSRFVLHDVGIYTGCVYIFNEESNEVIELPKEYCEID